MKNREQKKSIGKRCIAGLWAVAVVLSCSQTAFAEGAGSGHSLKGYVSAESTLLDRDSYVDGTQFENEPAPVSVLRVGIDYGATAVGTAEFRSSGDQGFQVGYFTEDRQFHEEKTVEQSYVVAVCAEGNVTLYDAYRWDVLYVVESGANAMAIIPLGDDAVTIYMEQQYRGAMECVPCAVALMNVINCVDLEDYVKGVVPYEMSSDWPMEALRAQAVCARTYAVGKLNAFSEYHFDLSDDMESQVYQGVREAKETTDQAVDSTAGQFVRYQGKICEIYYFAADGGATEDGLHMFDSDKPYLRGKLDPFETAVDFPLRDWTIHYSGSQLAWFLHELGYHAGAIKRLEPEYSEMGNVVAINFYDVSGACVRLTGRTCYTGIHLYDCRFTVDRFDDDFVFRGSGWGHNCGLSQWGARAMAEVYGYTYEDIIRFYFSGAYVA